jgi:hypothetical protein
VRHSTSLPSSFILKTVEGCGFEYWSDVFSEKCCSDFSVFSYGCAYIFGLCKV